MSGLVMEVLGKDILVLMEQGDFKRYKNIQNLDVGDEYIHSIESNKFRRYMAIAATFVFIAFSFYGLDSYYTPFGHLNVDINPSIDITYNKYLRVIDIKGINEDGIELASSLKSLKYNKVKDVVDEIVDEAEELEYLTGTEDDYVLLTVSENENEDEDKLDVDDIKVKNINAIKYRSTKEDYLTAKENGVSPGKVKLVNRITEEGYDIEELEKGLKEIKINVLMKSFNEMKKNERFENEPDKKDNENKPDKKNNENNSKSKSKGNKK